MHITDCWSILEEMIQWTVWHEYVMSWRLIKWISHMHIKSPSQKNLATHFQDINTTLHPLQNSFMSITGTIWSICFFNVKETIWGIQHPIVTSIFRPLSKSPSSVGYHLDFPQRFTLYFITNFSDFYNITSRRCWENIQYESKTWNIGFSVIWPTFTREIISPQPLSGWAIP